MVPDTKALRQLAGDLAKQAVSDRGWQEVRTLLVASATALRQAAGHIEHLERRLKSPPAREPNRPGEDGT